MTSLWCLAGYAFEFIKAVSDNLFDMINAVYYDKPLILIGLSVWVYQGCFWHCIWNDKFCLKWEFWISNDDSQFEMRILNLKWGLWTWNEDFELEMRILNLKWGLALIGHHIFHMITSAYYDKPLIFTGATFREKLVSHYRSLTGPLAHKPIPGLKFKNTCPNTINLQTSLRSSTTAASALSGLFLTNKAFLDNKRKIIYGRIVSLLIKVFELLNIFYL